MCTGRYDRSDSVVSVSTASGTRRTSPVDAVSRSFPGGPQGEQLSASRAVTTLDGRREANRSRGRANRVACQVCEHLEERCDVAPLVAEPPGNR